MRLLVGGQLLREVLEGHGEEVLDLLPRGFRSGLTGRLWRSEAEAAMAEVPLKPC